MGNDNWLGWKRIVIALKGMSVVGSPVLTAISTLRFIINGAINICVDRVVLDVGTWAYIESSIPDELALTGAKYELFCYDAAGEAYLADSCASDTAVNASKVEYLNGAVASTVFGADKGVAVYGKGKRGEALTPSVGDASAGTVILEGKDTANIVLVAVKLSPADGGALVRVREDVYYV